MSGSYGVLNQKYNTLLALTQNITSSISLTLQQVLTNNNITSLSAIFNNGTNNTTVKGTGVVISAGNSASFASAYTSIESLKLGLKYPFQTISYGTTGQVLTSGGSSGNLSWSNGVDETQRGIIDDLTTTTGTVSFATPYVTQPIVILTVNTDGTNIIIPVAVYNFTSVIGIGITEFTWISATTSNVCSINWIAYSQ